MITLIKLKRDTAADWATANPVLSEGEIGVETDTGYAKIGDGSTAWNSRPYWRAAPPAEIVSGAPSSTRPDGSLAVDTTNHRLYVRSGGVWKYTNLT